MLNAAPLPAGLEALWADFAELHDSRGSTGFGPMRITYSDMASWQSLTGRKLASWEVDAIRRADNAYLASWAQQQADKNG